MLNVYLIERTDNCCYNGYDSCVVVANNEDEAFVMADSNYYPFCRDKVEITKIDLNSDVAKPILGSFNAG